jgi:Protein of unknown function (DUF1552)
MNRLRDLRRRTFLKAVGLGIAAPLAAAMASRVGAAPAGRPTRLMLMYHPDGVPPEHYTPNGMGDTFDLQVGEAVLGPFEAYKQSLNVLLGLQIGAGEENHDAISQLLLPGKELGRSFEQVVAKALDVPALLLGATPLKSVGEQFNAGGKNVMFRDGDWIRTEVNPVRAADALFGKSASAAPPSDAVFRQQSLALTEGEVEALQKELAGLSSERSKLATHLDAIRQLKSSSARPGADAAAVGCGVASATPALDALRAMTQGGTDNEFFYTEANLPKIYPAQLEVAANALVCGSARVVGLQVAYGVSENVWSFLPGFQSGDQLHGTLSHADGSKPEIRARFAKAKRWLMQGLADKVLTTLSQPDPLDPSHSVLDNTLIFVFSELADGMMHNTNTKPMYIDNGRTMIPTQLPFFTLGGAGGALKTGRVLSFGNRPHTDLLMTLCELFGARGPDFGPFASITELST